MDFGVVPEAEEVINLGVTEVGVYNSIGSINKVNYMDIVKLVPSFISFDISVNALGWVRWFNNELTYGIYAFKEKEDTPRRQEFRKLITGLMGDNEFEYLLVEDVIGSCNFKTAKALYQLNVVPDDLIVYDLVKAKELIREGNKEWKSYIKKLSDTTTSIAKLKDKELIIECMQNIGFNDEVIKQVIPATTSKELLPKLLESDSKNFRVNSGAKEAPLQGIYDAMGLAVGVFYNRLVLKKVKRKEKLKTDINKGYQIKQFDDLYVALDYANESGMDIQELDFLNIKRDLKYNFKKAVDEYGDRKIFVIAILTSKLGVVALDKGLNLDKDVTYLVVYRK